MGNPLAPYLNYLANTWGLANDYTILSPHRVPNYIAMTSGDASLTTDCVPFNSTKTTCPLSSPNIVDRIEAAGLTWNAWAEDYPVTKGCSTDVTSARYDVKSFPFLYYTDITGSAVRCDNLRRANTSTVTSDYETDDLFLKSLSSTSTAANYNWLSPNSCDSMHSCLPLSTVATADNYLSNLVPSILNSYIFQTQKAALFLTFAEGVQKTVSTTDYVPTIWAGPVAKTGYQSSNQYDHYSMLKTIETSWGLSSLTSNDGNAGDMNEFLNAPLGVTITASPNPAEVGTQVKLTGIASGGTSPYTSYSWSFGDGTTATTTTASTTHTYTSTGTFSTTVTVTDSVSSTATSPTASVTVNKKLTITASASPTSTDTGVPVGFTATPVGGISPVSCTWAFGDGSSGNGCSTTHAYTSAGTMTATVDATDSIRVTATASVPVTIYSQLSVTASASPNPTEVGSQVSFTASAAGGTATYTSYAWSFGDGGTAITATATTTHTYASKGTFTATVKVTDSGSSTVTSASVSEAVNPKLAASATADSTQTDVGVSESFTAVTSGGLGSPTCSWSYGDGSTGSGCSTSYSYTSAGSFTASVTVTDSLGVTATGSVTLTINDLPVVDFSFTPTNVFTGHPANFTATHTGGTGPFTFTWDYGDGSQGTGNPVSHAYTTPGTFTVTVTISDAVGSTNAQSHSVTVTLTFGVTVSISPSLSEVRVQVSFTAVTSGGIGNPTCSWSFGDGSSGTGCSLNHTYTSAGNFTATVNAADSAGETATAVRQLTVKARLAVTASVSPNPTDVGISTSFAVKALGGVSSATCSWSFGDGSTGSGCSTIHTYSAAGTYSAIVNATDSLGVTATGSVTLTINDLPVVDFSFTPTNVFTGHPANFTATHTRGTGPFSFRWDFGDGSQGTGNPVSHTYTTDGTFTVTVTISDAFGSTGAQSHSVTVTLSFGVTITSISPSPSEVGVQVSFTANTVSGTGPYTCSWSFGDGSSGTGCSLNHTYTSAGNFTAMINAADSTGQTSSASQQFAVKTKLSVTGSVGPNPTDADLSTSFTTKAVGGVSPLTCNWSFGDGSSGTGCSATHIYTTSGTFTANVTITDSPGVKATTELTIVVDPKLVIAGVAPSPNPSEVRAQVSFTASTTGGTTPYVSYTWAFGDGTTATTTIGTASHTYSSAGTFNITVTLTDSAGSRATLSGSATINQKLSVTAKASPNPTEVSKPLSLTGTMSGGVGSPTCNWSFGDGSSGSGCSATHTYTTAGTFTAAVTMTDGLGVTATANVTVIANARLSVTAVSLPDPIDAYVPVNFTATSSGGVSPVTCSWSFGDGSSGNGCLTTHTYTTPGSVTAIVTSIDSLGITATSNVSETVYPKLVVTASASPSLTEVGKLTNFTGIISGGITPITCSWSFGDGTSSTGCSSTHAYPKSGSFTTSVDATDSLGVVAKGNVTVTVNPKLVVLAISANPNPTEVGRQTSFTGRVSGGVGTTTCIWDFGDGSSGSGCSANHTYAAGGTFTAAVTMTDGLGVNATANVIVTVNARLNVTASASPDPIDADVSVNFTASPSGGVSPVICSWTFGDGSSGNGCLTTHTYTSAGTFTASATSTDSLGITATGNVSETVHPKLVVSASVNPGLTEVGKLTGFTGTISGGVAPITCRWVFGDGSSSNGCSSIHTYVASGSFTANVTATDGLGIIARGSVKVTVNPKLVVTAVSASPTPTEVSKLTNFTGKVSGGVGTTTCSWDFGDGGTSGTCVAVYAYSTSGNFTVVVTATDSLGVSAISSITANVKLKLAIVMVVIPNSAEVGESTSFNGATSRGIGTPTCNWNFGDGTTDTGCLTVHIYAATGIFKATVNATDGLGVTVTTTVSVTITPRLTVGAIASSNPTVGTAVSFTAPTSGGVSPVSCSWTFGDGSSGLGCSIVHIYAAGGTFTATVNAIDGHNVTSTGSVTLVVALAVAISANPSSSEIGVPVTFTATADGGASYTFSWNFDDGTSQPGSITTHTFTSANLYTVRLTVRDSNGDMGSTVKLVQVQPALTVAVSSDSAGGTAPIMVRFNATAIWGVGPYAFSWDFGDGQQTMGLAPVHNYTTPSSYRVQVTVRDKLGITTSGSLTIVVTSQPSAPVPQPSTDPSAAGPIPAYYLVYGIGALFAVLILVVPAYAIMIHRRHKLHN